MSGKISSDSIIFLTLLSLSVITVKDVTSVPVPLVVGTAINKG